MRQYFEEQDIEVMEGPPSSPDPKPIEHLLPKAKRLLSQSKGLMTELEVKRLE